MTRSSLERSLEWMSMFLLLVGLAGMLCLLCLLLVVPSLPPGVAASASMSGSLVLLVGALGRLLLWMRRQRKGWGLPTSTPLPAETPDYQPVSQCSAVALMVLEMLTDEEFEQLPGYVLHALTIHRTAGRVQVARHLLEEWRSRPEGREQAAHNAYADQTRCSVYAGVEEHARLVTCSFCHQRVHQECSVLLRSVEIKHARLFVDPSRRLHCWTCLTRLFRQGFTLAYDRQGLLLVQHPNEYMEGGSS